MRYIIDSVCNENVIVEEIGNIEEKVLSNNISDEEFKKILDYAILTTRKMISTDINNDSYTNKCDLCQSIICHYLNDLEITNFPCMTQHVISDYIVGHSFVVVTYNSKYYLIDPTYKQFLKMENCSEDRELVINGLRILSPDPGFYIKEEDKLLFQKLLYNGYIELDKKTAGIYGNTFYHTKTNIPMAFNLVDLPGQVYLNSFIKGHERLSEYNVGYIELQSAKEKVM